MNTIPIYQAIILGIIQGLTEFLPISSTGHLQLVRRVLEWPQPGLGFDIALHAGTLIAIFGYFWRDWIDVTKPVIATLRRKDHTANPHFGRNLFWGIILGCIPAGIAGFLLNDTIDGFEQSNGSVAGNYVMLAVAVALIVVGIIMYLTDKYGSKRKKKLAEMNFVDWIVIGTAQAAALFPGVSRSGATISAGLARGMDRDSAARFSFLLSAPIVLAAVVKHALDLIEVGVPAKELTPMLVGLITSALVGYASIKFLLGYVRKHSYNGFVWYRLVLGVVILLIAANRLWL